jgi:hypothetical protein
MNFGDIPFLHDVTKTFSGEEALEKKRKKGYIPHQCMVQRVFGNNEGCVPN